MNNLLEFSRLHLLEKNLKHCFIKDPIHESINFSKDQYGLYQIVNTYEFQRLSRIRQLALTFLNFPSSTHTRYVHSLGVYELCNRFIDHFLMNRYLNREKDGKAINIALAAALLHDVGHGPLSHLFESIIPSFNHEQMGIWIISSKDTKINCLLRKKALSDALDEDFYISEIIKVFKKTSEYRWINELISSDIDIDRLDFVIRDSYYSGVSFGKTIDVSLLIKGSVIRDNRFLFMLKAKNHLKHFLLVRAHMYEDLYLNKISSVYEHLIVTIFDYFRNHKHLYKECQAFRKIEFLFKAVKDGKMKEFLDLYDDKFLDIIEDILEFREDSFIIEHRKLFLGIENDKTMSEYLDACGCKLRFVTKEGSSLELFDADKEAVVRVDV